MSSSEQYDNIPWDLVTGSFEGQLNAAERLELESWLASDGANRRRYELLESMWKERLKDYDHFERRDKEAGWQSLRQRIHADGAAPAKMNALSGRMRRGLGRGLLAAATIATLIFVIRQLITRTQGETAYHNTMDHPMRIKLSDGTLAVLRPGAAIRTGSGYGSTLRLVELDSGSVYFDVARKGIPFEVHAGNLNIRDIGTRFSVEQSADSVLVQVISGRVACKGVAGQPHVVTAGMAIAYLRRSDLLGQPVLSGRGEDSGRNRLQFKEAPLIDVIAVLENATGRSIRLQDASMEQLRLTANLDGETYEDAIKIICSSLDLSYSEVNGGGILKKRTKQ